MTSVGDWDQIIDEMESERFVGREQEVDFFRQHINHTPPRYLIFFITGQGGVGKSTLLNHYQEMSKDLGFCIVDCDEQQKDIPAVLGHFAQQLTKYGFSLKHFNERYKLYRQKMDEIENDPKAPQGLATMLGRIVVRASFIGGDLIPGVRKGLEFLPQETMEAQAGDWADYLAKKLTNKDEVALIREPAPILTSLFFDDLNEIAQRQRLLLCFDNFEVTQQELQGWFLRLREHKPSQNIRMVIAGRNKPGATWDSLRYVTATINLDVFSTQEAEAFLDVYDIKDTKRRTEILDWSGRLPVLMSWLAAPEGKDPDPTVPTSDIVERFLRWVDQPILRDVALRAAIPRTFNVDILQPLLEDGGNTDQPINLQVAFNWLQTMPFVKQHAEGWQYHEVVRRMMLLYQHRKSPQTYRQLQTILADFYKRKRNELGLEKDKQWKNEQWRRDTSAYIYHFLIADPLKHWAEIMSLFTIAVRKRRSYADEIIELMSSDEVYDELSYEQRNIVRLFRQQLQAIKGGDLQDGIELFNQLCIMADLTSSAKGYALTFRGECYQLRKRWEKAISDFENALKYTPDDIWILTRRANTYLQMKHYQEALADFERALALDEKNISVLIGRGTIYQLMQRYQEALADFERALALDEKDTSALIGRAEVYRGMGRYQGALIDFDQAIALDKSRINDVYMLRGLILSYLGKYADAIENYELGLKNNSNEYRALYNIAVAMFRWKGSSAAQAYIDRIRPVLASLLDTDERGVVFYGLGGLDALTNNTSEALDNLQEAVALKKEVIDWARHDIAWLDLRNNPRFQLLVAMTQ